MVKILLALVLLTTLIPSAQGISPTGSIQVTSPQRYSFSLGISSVDWGRAFGSSSGYVLRIEPGLSGGKLHLGIRSAFSLVFLPVTSVDVTGSLLYTWNDPWGGVKSRQTYAGMEFRMGYHVITATAGYYRHTAGDDPNSNWISSFGIGLGL